MGYFHLAVLLVCVLLSSSPVLADSTKDSLCAVETQSDSPIVTILNIIFRFPLTFTDQPPSDAPKPYNPEICSGGDLNLLERILDAVTSTMRALWKLLAESVPIPDTWINEENTDYFWWACERIVHISEDLISKCHPYGQRVMDIATQLAATVSVWMTSLPHVASLYLPNVITRTLADAISLVCSVANETWSVLVRYTVSALIAASCIKYMYPKEKNVCRKIDTKTSSKTKDAKVDKNSGNNETTTIHYPMCEFYDLLPCNCGVSENKKTVSTKTKHYDMCEYFDQLPCNCGAGEQNVENVGGSVEPVETQTIDYDKETIVSNEYFHKLEVKEDKLALENRTSASSGKQLSPLRIGVNGSPKRTRRSSKAALEVPDIAETFDETEEVEDAMVCDLNQSLNSDIGQPCFNSSFKEDDSFISHSSFMEERPLATHAIVTRDHLAAGDGVASAILTRRSPYEEVGVSFDESTCSEKLESFYDATSFLDMTDVNNSVSFHQGGGIFEFTLAFVVTKVIKLTTWFLKRKGLVVSGWKIHGVNDSKGENSKNKLYLLLPGNRAKRRSHRSNTSSRNNSASVLTELSQDGISVNDISKDESFLDQNFDQQTSIPDNFKTSNGDESNEIENLQAAIESLSVETNMSVEFDDVYKEASMEDLKNDEFKNDVAGANKSANVSLD